MNDLHDALRKAISDYMHIDDLSPRKQETLKNAHGRYRYNYDTVDALLVMPQEEEEESGRK